MLYAPGHDLKEIRMGACSVSCTYRPKTPQLADRAHGGQACGRCEHWQTFLRKGFVPRGALGRNHA